MEFHKIKDAKDPKGHYTPAVSYNGVLYISGQVPTDPITGEKFGDTLEEQFKHEQGGSSRQREKQAPC